MPNVKSKYFNIAKLLHNALVAELVDDSLVGRVAELFSQKNIGANCEVKMP